MEEGFYSRRSLIDNCFPLSKFCPINISCRPDILYRVTSLAPVNCHGIPPVGVIQRFCDAPEKECSRTVVFRWHLPKSTSLFFNSQNYNMFRKII